MNLDWAWMQEGFLGNSWDRWVVAACLFGGTLFLSLAVRAFLVARLGKVAARTVSNLDDLAVDLLRRTHFLFFFLVALHLAAHSLELSAKVNRVTNFAFTLVVFTQIGLWANHAVTFLGNAYVSRTLAVDAGRATTLRALLFLGQIMVWVTVVLLLLDNWGVKVAPFVAGLGIGGIAIALAVQNILGDLFASLSIVLDKPFVIGDAIGVDQEGGTVEYVGLKTTRIRRTSGEELIFSNSELLKSRIRNFKRMHERRVLLRIGVLYETDIAKLEAIPGWLKECVEKVANLRFGRAHFAGFGASALEFEMEYWVNSPDYQVYMDRQQELAWHVLRRFQAEKIEFAYPTQKIFVESLPT